MSHIPKPRGEEQNAVLMDIFKSNIQLRDNLAKREGDDADPDTAKPAAPATTAADD
jgi:hypothetical protein